MRILGIETSCDETAVGIVTDTKEILANVRLSYIKENASYGGIVPEITARAHLNHMESVLAEALQESGLDLADMDAIAATCGPGLIGGVLVGAMTGKALALSLNKPFLAINHLEAHILTARLCFDVPFPFLTLLVSGGHCQLIYAKAVGDYDILGSTRDDALGEAFDKVGKMMGLPYPGGPLMEKLAKTGDARRFNFPRPLIGKPGCDFSFSGLKTAVRREIVSLGDLSAQDQADIAASFQRTVTEVLLNRLERVLKIIPKTAHFVLSGGVASNQYIRDHLKAFMDKKNIIMAAPPIGLCTDNGAMIAWAGVERYQPRMTSQLDFAPRPRWPLTEL